MYCMVVSGPGVRKHYKALIKCRPKIVPEITRDPSKPASDDGRVLLYYCYTDVANPETLRLWQMQLCKALGLRGRIHVSKEGINGMQSLFRLFCLYVFVCDKGI